LSRQARLSGYERYAYTGQPKTFRTFREFAQWATEQHLTPAQIRHYLQSLSVWWKLVEEQELQLEETPEAFHARLIEMGMPPEGFEEAQDDFSCI